MTQPAWSPDVEMMRKTRLYQFMQKRGYADYSSFYRQSVQDIGWFWDEVVNEMDLTWSAPYREVINLSKGKAHAQWFVDGKCNLTINCLDRFAKDPASRNRLALIWEGDDGSSRKYTYWELCKEVSRCATGLKGIGVQPGDRVAVYLPMIPENVISILAIARIGAIFTPCFSGFGAEPVAVRMQDCEASVLITADGFYRRGKEVHIKEEADRAVQVTPSIQKVVVVERLQQSCSMNPNRDIPWSQLMNPSNEDTEVYVADSSEPFMIIYTSGTTGKPKGTVHTHSGFPIKAAFDAGFAMDVGPGDILFWVTDMGWMMGPWMIFGSLMNGSTMLLYEGTPDYPKPDRLWKIVAHYGVTHLGISPTLIRALMKHGDDWHHRHDLSSLRMFGSTGEPWNPDPWQWLFEKVGKSRIPIFNYSGGTETSGGILGNTFLEPIVPCGFSGPLPGMDADVLNEHGVPVHEEVGELVLRQPWVGMTKSFWNNDERYQEAYWSRWQDIWVHGDWVKIDEKGNWFITGRSDDTLKIAGKRLGPAEMESVLVSHPAVSEAATIGVPDEEKGEAAVCFVVLKAAFSKTDGIGDELISHVAQHLGKPLKPKSIFIVEDLPKTRNGKILRRVIRSAFLEEDAGDLSSLDNLAALEAIKHLADTRSFSSSKI